MYIYIYTSWSLDAGKYFSNKGRGMETAGHTGHCPIN